MERPYEKLLRYVKVFTTSDPENDAVLPSAEREFDLAKILVSELEKLGANDIRLSKQGYVYASVPATPGYEKAPKLGFIAHMDTAPDFCGENVKPRIIENYDGGEVILGTSGRVLRPSEFSHLPSLKGRTLIVTDGTTLLGADDKAGVAEIMSLIEKLKEEDIPHGAIGVAFTPDEEIGRGPDGFEVEPFGCKYAYTLDGGKEGEIEFENFNAASAAVRFKGVNVHPGSAKNIMINAALVAMEFNALLPAAERPEHTENYEGFYYLTSMRGGTEEAELSYILRDHSLPLLEAKKKTVTLIAKHLNEKYGEGTCTLVLKDGYRNMEEKIRPEYHLIENAIKACEKAGVEPAIQPIRGGTDGATLSFMGLPCPNLGTGGYGFHGPFEHITAEGMDKAMQIVLNLVEAYREEKE